MIVAELDPRSAGVLANALNLERRRLLASDRTWPPDLDLILSAALRAASSGNLADRSGQSSPTPCECIHPELMDLRGSARALGVSERTLRRLRSDGSIPTAVVGGRRFIRRSSIAAYLEQTESK